MNYQVNQNRIAITLLTMVNTDTGLYDIQRALTKVALSEIAKALQRLIPSLEEVKIEATSESMDDGSNAMCIDHITLRYGEDKDRTLMLGSDSGLDDTLDFGDEGDEEQLFALLDQFPIEEGDELLNENSLREKRFGFLHRLCTDLTEFRRAEEGENSFSMDGLIYDFNDESETSDEPTEVTTPA